ncbi:Tad domain-containing protein [Phreatobacter stygius]|uniref:Tad domain-containing protein n=1 Tax=Phreatobacter stygius TaxID=1940610 RepID=UPI001476E0DD|nr:Tad domain-containing protein [Phreatobacter stygius]
MAVIFAVAIVPIMAMIGAAVDYSRGAAARAKLQAAVDAATLTAARNAGRMSDADLKKAVERALQGNMIGETTTTLGAVRVTKVGSSVRVEVDSSMQTSIWGVVGINSLDVNVVSQVRWNTPNIEIALVLDNTGSMSSNNKMTELKKAVLQFLKDMEDIRLTTEQVRISIVPFDTLVNIGTGTIGTTFRNSNWIRFDTTDLPTALRTTQQNWRGCLTDRDQPNDVNDATPNSTATRYRAADCANDALAQMNPLTSNFDTLRTVIGKMSPSGNTNITIGMQLGLATLSTGAPFTETASADPEVKRFMVLLTDGENTQNRFSNSSSAIDARAKLMCDAIKLPANRITLFTVRVIDGDEALLKACASPPVDNMSFYFSVTSAVGINAAFKSISDLITRLRLSV